MADRAGFERATALGVCCRCICLFIDPKNEDILLKPEEEICRVICSKLGLNSFPKQEHGHNCPCCMNCLQHIFRLAEAVEESISKSHLNDHDQSVFLNIVTPPILETVRIACRTIVTTSPIKLHPFPCWDELLARLIARVLEKKVTINSGVEMAKIEVDIVFCFHDEIGLAKAIDPNFIKAKKRRFRGVQLRVVDYNFAFERMDEDNALSAIKRFASDSHDLDRMSTRLHSYFKDISLPNNFTNAHEAPPLTWSCSAFTLPIYLIGRYRKYSREISQAKWTVSEENDESDDEGEIKETVKTSCKDESASNSEPGLSGIRKGKMSVEEIVCEAVMLAMEAKDCQMHPCGREDIDVRMLGNGRPFVLKVIEATKAPSESNMRVALDYISSGKGLNIDKDVEVICLEKTSHSTWANMQHVAEEKRKGYACVCWSADPLTPEIAERIESATQLCKEEDNEENTPCLQITQKTPLRVLHRRSQLTRTRHIYSMSVAILNDHYFILNVITSAGAYVKEFVHGDLGRTFPSISSIIGCPADILQLDVTWLFDSFAGCEAGTVQTASDIASFNVNPAKFTQNLSWMKLKSFPLAKVHSAEKPKLRYSILGTSFISGVMVEAIQQSADGEVYCVCGRTASTLEAFAKEHDVAVTYSDYSAMLEDPKVDIVYIGLPTCVHAEWVVKCARAGKHILNEKSFAINALDTEEALKEVRMHKVFCMEAQMHRCHPLIPQLREIVLEKKPVGEVLSVNASFTANIIDLFNRQAGGSILDLGCYPMSLVRYLFGEPVSMTGSATIVPPAKPGESAFDSETTVTVVFRSGLQAVIHTSNKAAHHWEFNVVCEGGQVSLSDLWRREVDDEITITRAAAGEGAPDAEERIVCNPPHNFYTLQIDTVNQAVRSGAVEASSPAMTWQDSVDNMRALDMWRKAIGLRYEAFE